MSSLRVRSLLALATGVVILISLLFFSSAYVMVGAALALLLAALIVIQPELALLGGICSILLPLASLIHIPVLGLNNIGPDKLIPLVGVAVYAILRRRSFRIYSIMIALVTIAGWTFLLPNRPEALSSVQVLKALLGLMTPWLIAGLSMPFATGRRLETALIYLPAGSVLVGFILNLFGKQSAYIQTQDFFRLTGTQSFAAYLGILAFIGTAVALGRYAREGKRTLLWAILNLCIVIASGARGATVGALILFIPFVWVRLRKLRKQHIVIAMLVFLITSPAIYLGYQNLAARMFSASGALNDSGRFTAWAYYFGQAMESPWFGRGLGAASLLGNEATFHVLPYPHNEYLRMFVDAGLIGLAIFLTALGLSFRQILGKTPPSMRKQTQFLFLAFLALALVDNVLITTAFTIPFGAYLACLQSFNNPSESPVPSSGERAG